MKEYFFAMPWITRPTKKECVDAVFKVGKQMELKKGDVLMDAGSPLNKFIYVEHGLLGHATNENALKKPQLLFLTTPGRMTAAMPVANCDRNISRCYAARDSIVCIACLKDILALSEKDATLKEKLYIELVLNLRMVSETFAVIAMLPPKERLALFFKVILLSYGTHTEKEFHLLPVNLTLKEYAQAIYSTEQIVTRIITSWKKEGIVKKLGRHTLVSSRLTNRLMDKRYTFFFATDQADFSG